MHEQQVLTLFEDCRQVKGECSGASLASGLHYSIIFFIIILKLHSAVNAVQLYFKLSQPAEFSLFYKIKHTTRQPFPCLPMIIYGQLKKQYAQNVMCLSFKII